VRGVESYLVGERLETRVRARRGLTDGAVREGGGFPPPTALPTPARAAVREEPSHCWEHSGALNGMVLGKAAPRLSSSLGFRSSLVLKD